jgi:hypothetical protein
MMINMSFPEFSFKKSFLKHEQLVSQGEVVLEFGLSPSVSRINRRMRTYDAVSEVIYFQSGFFVMRISGTLERRTILRHQKG